jgi:hypothetical protein
LKKINKIGGVIIEDMILLIANYSKEDIVVDTNKSNKQERECSKSPHGYVHLICDDTTVQWERTAFLMLGANWITLR